jgi:hypothetical protein
MVPLIHSWDEVVVAPVDPTRVEVGDIVMTKVAGNVYIHPAKAIELAKRRVQIDNPTPTRRDPALRGRGPDQNCWLLLGIS